jgi:two-component system response regulator AtoC
MRMTGIGSGTNRAIRTASQVRAPVPPNLSAALIMTQNFSQPGPVAAIRGAHQIPAVHVIEATSPSMRAVMTVIRELAHNSVPVLLIGEHGTGKQAIAQQIHQNSAWSDENFFVKNCRDLSFESILPEPTPSKATLYLDEAGDLNRECQATLSELLAQAGKNGSGRTPLRVICGSSRDLESDVRAGSFQEELYYRLSGVCLRIPPLRQRREDIPQLIAFFMQRYAAAYGCTAPALSPSTQQLFEEYSWPGNLPQLEAAVRTIVAVGNEATAMTGLRSMLTRSEPKSNGGKVSLKQTARAASREAEKELILKVLTRTRWNRRRAAQELQISYKALLYKLKQIGYGEYGTS